MLVSAPSRAAALQAMADTRPFTETIRVDSGDLTSMPSWIGELAEHYGIQWILGVSVEITSRESGDVGISGKYVRISACVGGGDKFADGGGVVASSLAFCFSRRRAPASQWIEH